MNRAATGFSDYAVLAHRAERSRLAELAGVDGVRTRAGDGWLAIRTGLDSNDLNGALSEPGHRPDAALLAELGVWFGTVPASWQLAAPDPGFAVAAADAGWQPETSARCSGRRLPFSAAVPPGVVVRQVAGPADATAWLDVAEACEWFDADERQRREPVLRALVRPRWIACRDGLPVGMASGWRDREVAEVVDVAVLPAARRAGVGTALLAAVAGWADSADHLVAAPSPDGWAMMRTLGFENRPALSEVIAYWN